MYTFKNINLDYFLNSELREVSIVPYNLTLRFEKEKENYKINIAGKWAIYDEDGSIFDQGDPNKYNIELKIHNLLENFFCHYEVPKPEELHINFSDGKKLIIYDDEQYEICSISPNIIV